MAGRFFVDMDDTLVAGVYGSPFTTRGWTTAGCAIWRVLKPYAPTLISKVPDERLARSYAEKREWVSRELGADVPLIVVPDSLGKAGYCRPGDVLVDNDIHNCQAWREAGGVAIVHVNRGDTVARLDAILQAMAA